MGVKRMAGTLGWTMDPPAATEYAVLPVGVASITPSACTWLTADRTHSAVLLMLNSGIQIQQNQGSTYRHGRTWVSTAARHSRS